jgi:hypothetical protein
VRFTIDSNFFLTYTIFEFAKKDRWGAVFFILLLTALDMGVYNLLAAKKGAKKRQAN